MLRIFLMGFTNNLTVKKKHSITFVSSDGHRPFSENRIRYDTIRYSRFTCAQKL